DLSPSTAPIRFRHGCGLRPAAAAFPSACAAGSLPRAPSLTSGPLLLPQPRWRRRQQHPPRANPSTERLRGDGGCGLRGSGKYIAPDYLVRKVSAEEVQELVRGHTKVPLIVEFYATWCGPCVQMAQDIEMVRHAPCQFPILWFCLLLCDCCYLGQHNACL
ncbi:hypothetical protein BDA96_07G127900, partial [Sorghum bicolor]